MFQFLLSYRCSMFTCVLLVEFFFQTSSLIAFLAFTRVFTRFFTRVFTRFFTRFFARVFVFGIRNGDICCAPTDRASKGWANFCHRQTTHTLSFKKCHWLMSSLKSPWRCPLPKCTLSWKRRLFDSVFLGRGQLHDDIVVSFLQPLASAFCRT